MSVSTLSICSFPRWSWSLFHVGLKQKAKVQRQAGGPDDCLQPGMSHIVCFYVFGRSIWFSIFSLVDLDHFRVRIKNQYLSPCKLLKAAMPMRSSMADSATCNAAIGLSRGAHFILGVFYPPISNRFVHDIFNFLIFHFSSFSSISKITN